MLTRITLAALAAVVLITAPAEARSHKVIAVTTTPSFDVAARPAYPTEAMPGTAAGRRGLHAMARHRTTGHSQGSAGVAVRASEGQIGSGIVRSAKTGATARVAARYQAKFQAYVDDLEAHGAAIYYMGGIRPGRCSPGSQHPCGSALDVCQDRRGHVSGARDCNLPRPAAMAAIAEAHGLHEGAVWCSRPDYGHAQVIPTGSECQAKGSWGRGRYLATMTGKMVRAPAKHRHQHVAERGGGRL